MSTPGARKYANAGGHLWLAEGEYGINPADGVWYARPPGYHTGSLEGHKVVEHEDGTITVSPSILIHDHDQYGNPREWHGYLRKGVWQEC